MSNVIHLSCTVYLVLISITGLNVLSGSTWKGAKLRIGEAKPDYAQRHVISHIHKVISESGYRLEKERMQEVEPKLKRRRLARGVQGVESRDMSLVTPENVENRPVSNIDFY